MVKAQKSRFQKYQFPLVLATVFLDILGLGILIPSFPTIISSFNVGGEWQAYAMAIYALGTFIGGLFLWRWSDSIGRRPTIMLTTAANFTGFIFLLLPFAFPLFLLGRFIAGIAGGGLAVIQAYVSDISTPNDRAKNMGLIGAMFGIAFLVGPAIGGILAPFGTSAVAIAGAAASLLNFLLIYFILPEPVRIKSDTSETQKIQFTPGFLILLALTFLASMGFAPIQSLSGQYLTDTFAFTATDISHVLIVVGISAILYQGVAMRYLRKYVSETPLLIAGLFILMIALPLYAYSPLSLYTWFILPFLAIGNGSIMPGVSSLISSISGNRVGAYLGLNSSAMSVGSIAGPTLAWVLYSFHHDLPYYVSGWIYLLALGLIFTARYLHLLPKRDHAR